MNRLVLLMLGSAVVVVASFISLRQGDLPKTTTNGTTREPLVLFCAASNRAVVEAIRDDYEHEYKQSIQIQYGASQTLLSSMEVSETGDLFLPADDSFLAMGRKKGMIAEILHMAEMRGVVAVRRENPKNVTTFDDLLRSDVRVVQASPDASAIGQVTRLALSKSQHWERLEQATTAFRTTVTDVANDLVVGAADAGIVYDAVLKMYPDLQAIEIPEFSDIVSQVSVGVVAQSKQPQAALHFARYLAARDRGLKQYKVYGFRVVQGDVWHDVPELSVFAGSMLRPAIEDTLTAFEAREGVRVTRIYNGCGILVAQMKAGQHPDAYFACDREFMKQVPDLFPRPVDVSMNELVILVQKGNPHSIRSLRDLAKKGLRVGVGHEKQCAMGWLTQNTFREGGVLQEVMENVTVQTPSGDMLVNQMRTGSLDAAVAYLSNAAGAADYLDAIQIEGIACSVATQPFAIAENSPNAQLAGRLFQRLCSADSQQIFLAEGFRWQFPTVADE